MTFRILKTGHIQLREQTENGFHRSVIAPNESIPTKYQAEIESDPNFAKYRTQENADAYEQSLIPEPKTKAELEAEAEREAERIVLQEMIAERKELNPVKDARDTVKAKIADGTIKENAGKAIRDEIQKAKP